MFFQNNNNKYPKPSLLVLETESILIHFDENGQLPFDLETTHVCDCVSLIIYSFKKGIAYLNHVNFYYWKSNDLTRSVAKIIKQYDLNSDNTFVALIGAQDVTLSDLKLLEEILKKHFSNIIIKSGGNDYTERCIKLSFDKLEFIEIDCANKQVQLLYQNLAFSVNHQFTIRPLIKKIIHHENDQTSNYYSPQLVEKLNDHLKNPSNFFSLEQIANDSLKIRRAFRKKSAIQYEDTARVSRLRDMLNLQPQVKIILSPVLYDCLIFRPNVFNFLKIYIGLETVKNFNYEDINKFRYPIIQQLLKEKRITVQQVTTMTLFSEKIFNNSFIAHFLMNNLSINEIFSLTEDHIEIQNMISLFNDLLIMEELGPDQLVTLNFTEIKKLSNGEPIGIQAMSRDAILHSGGRPTCKADDPPLIEADCNFNQYNMM